METVSYRTYGMRHKPKRLIRSSCVVKNSSVQVTLLEFNNRSFIAWFARIDRLVMTHPLTQSLLCSRDCSHCNNLGKRLRNTQTRIMLYHMENKHWVIPYNLYLKCLHSYSYYHDYRDELYETAFLLWRWPADHAFKKVLWTRWSCTSNFWDEPGDHALRHFIMSTIYMVSDTYWSAALHQFNLKTASEHIRMKICRSYLWCPVRKLVPVFFFWFIVSFHLIKTWYMTLYVIECSRMLIHECSKSFVWFWIEVT